MRITPGRGRMPNTIIQRPISSSSIQEPSGAKLYCTKTNFGAGQYCPKEPFGANCYMTRNAYDPSSYEEEEPIQA